MGMLSMFSVDPYVLIIRGVPHELLVSFEPESEPPWGKATSSGEIVEGWQYLQISSAQSAVQSTMELPS
jgi:hypothetical protein